MHDPVFTAQEPSGQWIAMCTARRCGWPHLLAETDSRAEAYAAAGDHRRHLAQQPTPDDRPVCPACGHTLPATTED